MGDFMFSIRFRRRRCNDFCLSRLVSHSFATIRNATFLILQTDEKTSNWKNANSRLNKLIIPYIYCMSVRSGVIIKLGKRQTHPSQNANTIHALIKQNNRSRSSCSSMGLAIQPLKSMCGWVLELHLDFCEDYLSMPLILMMDLLTHICKRGPHYLTLLWKSSFLCLDIALETVIKMAFAVQKWQLK